MKIPSAYFQGLGQKIPRLSAGPTPDASPGVAIGEAAVRFGDTIAGIAKDRLEEKKEIQNLRDNAAAQAQMYAHKNDLALLAGEITSNPEIPPENYLDIFREKAERVRGKRLEGLDERRQNAIWPSLDQQRYEFEQTLMGATEKKLQDQALSNVIKAKDELFRSPAYSYQEKIAQVSDPRFWEGTGLSESEIMKEVLGMTQKLYKIEEASAADDLAGGIWEQMRPGSVNDELRLDDMRRQIREGDAPQSVKDLAVERVEQHATEYEQSKRLAAEAEGSRIYGLAVTERAPYSAVVKAIHSSDNLDERSKSTLLDWADRHYQVSQAQDAAKRQKDLQYLSKLLTFQQQYLDGSYGILDPQQISLQATELGPFTDDAMRFVVSVNDNLGTAKLTDGEFKDVIRLLRQNDQYKNLLPKVDKGNEEDKARMALLQGRVHQLMSVAAKEGPGKGISVRQAVLQSIRSVMTDEGTFWDTSEPIYLLGSDLASDYGQDPKSWPEETLNAVIEDAFRRNPSNAGRTLTPALREAYRKELLR